VADRVVQKAGAARPMSLHSMIETRPLLKETEAARILNISVKTLRRWRWLGNRGPAFRRIGACIRYHPKDLEAYIEANRCAATSDQGMEAEVR
jgi:Helix-turn-helix domain